MYVCDWFALGIRQSQRGGGDLDAFYTYMYMQCYVYMLYQRTLVARGGGERRYIYRVTYYDSSATSNELHLLSRSGLYMYVCLDRQTAGFGFGFLDQLCSMARAFQTHDVPY